MEKDYIYGSIISKDIHKHWLFRKHYIYVSYKNYTFQKKVRKRFFEKVRVGERIKLAVIVDEFGNIFLNF